MVLTEFPESAMAESYLALPWVGLGVEGAPEIGFWQDAEQVAY